MSFDNLEDAEITFQLENERLVGYELKGLEIGKGILC